VLIFPAMLLLLPVLVDPVAIGDERLLQDAKVAASGPALIKFFQRRIPSPRDAARAEELIRQLGDGRFSLRQKASRELIELGPAALKFLRPALSNPDPEVVRRANSCIAVIEPDSGLPGVAARALARKAPGGAIAVLLAYLPVADDAAVEDEVLLAIVTLARRPGAVDPALIAALNDAEPIRRGAAGFVLGRHADKQARELAVKLLADPSPLVRLRAAEGLLAGKDTRSIPALIELLADAPEQLADHAEELLIRVAGAQAPQSQAASTPATPRDRHDTWAKWWTSHAKDVDLAKLDERSPSLGYTVIAQAKRVLELDQAGRVRWTLGDVNMAIEAIMLANGRVLITENAGRRVTERDLKGKIHWEYKTPDQGLSGRRLPNGNTFVSTNSTVSEVSRNGKEIYVYRLAQLGAGNRINAACKLTTGRILVLTEGGDMNEVDARTGKLVVRHKAPDHACYSVEALPRGGWLVTAYGSAKVIEYNASGKTVWEYALPGAFHATRLPNGNTLIASHGGKRVVEVNRFKKTVWEKQFDDLIWRAHRR
jgi:outer membrane protein assembly factor BamB